MKKQLTVATLSFLLCTGYSSSISASSLCSACPCEQTKSTCSCPPGECNACSSDNSCIKNSSTRNILETAESCNEVTVSIDLKNYCNDVEEWKEALNIAKDWGKNLTHMLQDKTPHVELDVKIAGFSCCKSGRATKSSSTRNIMAIAENCNEITVSIDLKNNCDDIKEWKEALNIVKDWGKDLANTLQDKTPNVELDVKIAGFSCYKTGSTQE